MERKDKSIGFIGCGNMAKAIMGAIEGKYRICAYDILSCEHKTAKSANEVVENSDIIFICVKPQDYKTALEGLNFGKKILISIMAGVTVRNLKAYAGKIVRVMPNLNATMKKSVNAFCESGLTSDEKGEVVKLLSTFGEALEISEEKFSAVTALSGSAPAFVFEFIRGLEKAGEAMGLEKKEVKQIIAKMLEGSAMLAGNSENLEALVDSVCCKGGTTIEGVSYLRENRFLEVVEGAAVRSYERAEKLKCKM